MTTRFNSIGTAGRKGTAQNAQGTVADPYLKTFVIPIVGVASTASQDTGVELPANGVVQGGYLNVTTASAGAGAETMIVGNTTDPNGILNAVDVGTVGIKNVIVDPGMSLLGENVLFDLVAADLDDLRAELVLLVLASDV